jgi:hypothetical protein
MEDEMTDAVSTADERAIRDPSIPADAGWAGAEIAPDCCSERKAIPLDEFWARLDKGRR